MIQFKIQLKQMLAIGVVSHKISAPARELITRRLQTTRTCFTRTYSVYARQPSQSSADLGALSYSGKSWLTCIKCQRKAVQNKCAF